MNDIEKAIKTISDIYMEYLFSQTDTVNLSPYDERLLEVHTLLENYLQAQSERDNPQPLTLEQLKQRVGKPVWITGTDEWQVISSIIANRLYAKGSEGEWYSLDNYGKTWLAYDHEPKENENENT